MKKLFFLFAVAIIATLSAAAQMRTVAGTVLDADTDEPLIGASVLPVGSSIGVATDVDGRFKLTIPDNIKEITVSYVGMTTVTLPVQNFMEVRLKQASSRLEEIVVTGYGSGKKLGSVVGSVAVVGQAALADNPTPNFVDALQGQVPGLDIYSNSGEPSSTSQAIRIRGTNSLEAGNTPLFILDGAPVSSTIFTTLNSADIEKVTVLKDASATAIYGSRAANGVIVITTKKGKFGEDAQVTVRANIGWSSRVQDKVEMMNSKQYLSFREKMATAFGATDLTQEEKDLINVYGIDTNWRDYFFNDHALTYSIEGSVRGGGERSNYYLSLGHLDQDGLIVRSGMRRETLRGSFDARVKEWLKVGFNTNIGFQKYETNSYAASSEGNLNGPVLMSYLLLPYDSPYYYTFDENGKIKYGEKADWFKYTFGGTGNPDYINNLTSGGRSNLTINANIYEQINPVKGLTLRAQQAAYGFDYRNSTNQSSIENFETPMGDMTQFPSWTATRSVSESFQRFYQFTYTNTAEYNFTVNNVHDITALLGQESIIAKSDAFGVTTYGQPNDTQMLLTNGTDVSITDISNSVSKYVINSYFLNLSYSFDNRYFFDFSIRRDGSSKFADGHRWATFFAIGGMWNAKNEKFLQPVTWLDDLKVRVNYGTTGNSSIDPYMYYGTVGSGANPYNGQNTLGLASQSNNELTWETVRQFDAGVSFGFLDRLYGSADFYVKNTHDMLMDVPYSATTGWTSGYANIGSMRNTGIDFELGAHIYRTKDWYVGARVNFNYNRNIITELFNGQDRYELSDYGMVFEVGEDPFQINTVRYAGVDPADGKQMWYDLNGNKTKVYSDTYAVNTGKSYHAPWTGGFGVDARWKGIALKADFAFAAEKYIQNWGGQFIANPMYMYNLNQSVEMLNSWTTPGQITDMPAITETIQADSRYIQNCSFVRMKNVTLSYTLPKQWTNAIDISNVVFHFTGRNLLTWSNKEFTGYDPEYENNGVRFQYPNTRQFEFGVEVSF